MKVVSRGTVKVDNSGRVDGEGQQLNYDSRGTVNGEGRQRRSSTTVKVDNGGTVNGESRQPPKGER